MEKEHIAKATDLCYGMTGGVRIDCSCGSYWVVSQKEFEMGVDRVADHIAYGKKQLTRPD